MLLVGDDQILGKEELRVDAYMIIKLELTHGIEGAMDGLDGGIT